MKKGKYTPGPWKFSGLKLRNENNKIVFTEPQFNSIKKVEEAKANAVLIESAPEMIELLKEIRVWYEEKGAVYLKSYGVTPVCFSEALSLIKKIEG